MTTASIVKPSNVPSGLLGPAALLGLPSPLFPADDALALPNLDADRLFPQGAKRAAKDEDEGEAEDEDEVDDDEADDEDEDFEEDDDK